MEKENKRALVFGGDTGMDGQLMVELLTSKGYEVVAASGYTTKELIASDIEDFKPHEIYNFAGISHTVTQFDNLENMILSNLMLPTHMLNAILTMDPKIKFFQASSCLIFGRTQSWFHNEQTVPAPAFDYGTIKLAAQTLVKQFREEKGLFACSAIYFPHEHPKRREHFFTKKICMAVARIKMGSTEKIKLTSQPAWRDWLWAPDAVEAAHMMLQAPKAEDYVVGSGVVTDTNRFIWDALLYAGLNPGDHITEDKSCERKNDLVTLKADITKIKTELGWSPKHDVQYIIKSMVDHEIEQLKNKI